MIESTPVLFLNVQLINVKLLDEVIPPLNELMIVKSFKTRPFVLDNIGEVEKQTPEDVGIGVLTENWDLYGYIELDGIRKSYEEDLLDKLSNYSKAWNDMTEEERTSKGLNYISGAESYEATTGRKEYLHLSACLGNKNNPQKGTIYYRLNELQDQIDDVQEDLDECDETLAEYKEIMDINLSEIGTYEHLPQRLINARTNLLFSGEELKLINILLHDTDYTNSNIFYSTMDSLDNLLDKEKELYDDAMDKLYEVSQP